MPSDLQVSNIKANDGTAGISIADSTGNITLNNPITSGTFNGTIGSSAVGDGIITCAESLTLDAHTAEFSTSGTTLSGFTKRADFGNVASITESSGSFTTSSTGIFFISAFFDLSCANTDPDWIDCDVKQVISSTETLIVRAVTSVNQSATLIWKSVSLSFMYDWQDTSHILKFKFAAEANTKVIGDSNGLYSRINFLRIGNT